MPSTVLENICRKLLYYNPPDSTGPRTVTALAVTARIFHEPALDVLWHTIPDIAVLFLVLPKELCSDRLVSRTGRRHKQILTRLLAYAQRVRVISSSAHVSRCTGYFSAVPKAYDTLASILGSRILLPNIEKINYTRFGDITPLGVFQSFGILFGPKLRAMRISSCFVRNPAPITQSDEEAFAQMLKQLADIKPPLQGLYIWKPPNTSTITSSVASIVCTLDSLVSLKLPYCDLPLTPAAFEHLARLPGLRELDCRLDDSEEWVTRLLSLARLNNSQDTAFPVLRTLFLIAPTLALPTDLLRFVSSPHLTKLSIIAEKAVPRCDIDSLFTVVVGLRSAKTITQLCVIARNVVPTIANESATISTTSSAGARRAPRPIGRKTLEPLLAMTALDDITLLIRCPFDVDDALLEAFAKTWPKLDRFQLGHKDSWGLLTVGDLPEDERDPDGTEHSLRDNFKLEYQVNGEKVDRAKMWHMPRATLFGLLAFAQRCLRIGVLHVELNANLHAVPPALLEVHPMQGAQMRAKLSSLHVGLSPIRDPYAVAAFLSAWVVGIAEIKSGWEDLMDEDDEEEDDDDVDDDDFEEDSESLSDWPYTARVYNRRWKLVGRLILFFAAVRTQEWLWKRQAAGLPKYPQRAERREGDISTVPPHTPPGFWDNIRLW
ncbi:hypothetical protein VTO73DRAFT_14265 [Trametes versicolor]